ncbi:hypothetical protein BpHYR1_048479, partial [Brachionus plicatilis]
EAEKVVQASTSSDLSKKRYFKRQINKYKLRHPTAFFLTCGFVVTIGVPSRRIFIDIGSCTGGSSESNSSYTLIPK